MSEHSPFEQSISELQAAMAAGHTNAVALVNFYQARIDAYDRTGPQLNAIRAVCARARERAEGLDAERRSGRVRGPLHGIPIIVKDNYETLDEATTAGSILLANFETGRDATLVARLREAGAVIFAKANMHEFAYGITTAGSLFGQTRNPYDPTRNPGGSSGGTGAAVAANFATVGMGSDTCGSIRIPAAHNNLVGLRGTQGLASRFGIVPLSHTQDIGGPIARCVADLAIVLDATVGFDPNDPQTEACRDQLPPSYHAALASASLDGVHLGLLAEAMPDESDDEEVGAAVRKAALSLAACGAAVRDVSHPKLRELLDGPLAGMLVLMQDFKWDIGDYLSAAGNAPVRSLADIIESGAYHPSLERRLLTSEATQARDNPAYQKELTRHKELRKTLLALLRDEGLDGLVYPTIRRLPVAVGIDEQEGSNCKLSAQSGLPAISVPAGFSAEGIPIGLELLGLAWSETKLLQIAQAIETHLQLRRAPNSTPPLAE